MAEGIAEFSVYWWDADGNQHQECRFVKAETAILAYSRLTRGPAAMLGMVRQVIITDGGDCCNAQWIKGKGQVFPTEN